MTVPTGRPTHELVLDSEGIPAPALLALEAALPLTQGNSLLRSENLVQCTGALAQARCFAGDIERDGARQAGRSNSKTG